MKFKHVLLDCYSERNYHSRWDGAGLDLDLIGYEQTNIVLRAVDALVSPLSTILLEAALFGLPIAVYKPKNPSESSALFSVHQERIDFLEFYQKLDPPICDQVSNLWPTVKKLTKLIKDNEYRKGIKEKVKYFVEADKDYSIELTQAIDDLVG